MALAKRLIILAVWFLPSQFPLPAQLDSPATTSGDAASLKETYQSIERLRNEGKFDKGLDLALAALDQAYQLDDPALIAEGHYQTAILYNFLGNFEQAGGHLEIGLSRARAVGLESLVADLLVARGIVEWKLGNLALATQHLEDALVIRQEEGDLLALANIANNLGIIQYSLKDYKAAVSYYLKGIKWLGELENDRLRASLYSNLAESLVPEGNIDEAEAYLLKALEIEQKTNEPHSIAYTYLNLGELRTAQNLPMEAIEWYQKALDLQESIDAIWPAALTRIKLAREYLDNKMAGKALEILEPGYESAKELNALSLLRDYAQIYAEVYTSLGRNGASQYYQDLHDWLTRRVEQPLPEEPRINVPRAVLDNAAMQYRSEDLMSAWIRIGALALLSVLIAFLVVENMRLRRTISEKEHLEDQP